MTDDAGTAPHAKLRAARLVAHGLSAGVGDRGRAGFATPADAIDRLVCVQAQDLAAAKWVLGARVPGSVEATIDTAIDTGSLLRSWPMRGTLHFVAPGMLRPILSVTSARLLQRSAKTMRDDGIDEAVAAAAREVAIRELEGGRSASRDELQSAWSAAGIGTDGQRGYHLIWRLANEGLLCGGPVETRARQRFVLLDEWSPRRADEPEDDDEILARLFVGYARGHGPVTVRDFAWWTGLTLAQARRAVAAAGDAIVPYGSAESNGEALFAAADAPEPAAAAAAAGAPAAYANRHVLAPFDEYFLGYGDRTAFCSPDDAARIVPGKNGMFLSILVADGEVVGTWRRAPERRGAISIEVTPFSRGLALDGFRPAFERWAEFWGSTLGEVSIAP